MKFTQRKQHSNMTLSEQICLNRNTTTDIMLRASRDFLLDQTLLDNIEEGCELLIRHLRAQSKIVIVVDSDVDGKTSAAIIYNYIYRLNPNLVTLLTVLLHPGKQHGLTDDMMMRIDDIKPQLVVLPDSSSNDFEQHKKLKDDGVDVLVIDHHDCDEGYSQHAIVINNQLSSRYSNKANCGAGVSYQFCREMDRQLNRDFADEFLGLAAFGLVADMMDVTSPETRYMIDAGLSDEHMNSKLMRRIADSVMNDEINSQDISFSFAPPVNATIRVGEQELKERVFRALLLDGEQQEVESNKRGALGKQMESLVTQVVRNMGNAKNQQKKQVDKLVESLANGGDFETKPIVVQIENDVNPSLVGLVANKLSSEHQCPCFIFRETVDGYAGSCRAYSETEMRDIVSNFSSVTMAQGHGAAFGIAVNSIEDFRSELSEHFAGKVFEVEVEYDAEYQLDTLPPIEELLTVASLNEKTGQGFPKPILKISGMTLNAQNTSLVGSRNNVIRSEHGYFAFVQMFANQAKYEKLLTPEYELTNLYVSVTVNNYEGKTFPQFRIEHVEHYTDFSEFVF